MRRIRRGLLLLILSTGAFAAGTGAALAGPLSGSTDCTTQRPLEQPFTAWGDYADYVLAPDGGFEDGAEGWRLTGGAAVSEGNEDHAVHAVHAADDHRALTLPAGSSATSAPLCIGEHWPTIRLFSRADGARMLSSMRVDVLYEDSESRGLRSLRIATLEPGEDWQPTPVIDLVVNRLAAFEEDGLLPVAFRFTPSAPGTWQIDDLYIDPWRGP